MALPALGQEDCEAPSFPEAAEVLAQQGYPAEEYAVLITWVEAAGRGGGPFVIGYRLEPQKGGGAFDVYTDREGNLLTDEERAALGVRSKKWDLRPVERLPESLVRAASKRAVVCPAPLGPARGMAASATVGLPRIDLSRVTKESKDAGEAMGKGVERIGVFQEIPQGIVLDGSAASHGSWRVLEDGSFLWSMAIESPEARGQRVHFAELAMPEGAQVVVYNAGFPDEAYGPYTGLVEGEEGLWAATCFSETVVVECAVPADVGRGGLRVVIDKTAHIYADFASLQWGKAEPKALGDAGWCNLDVACYPDWYDASLGVGGLGTIGNDGVLWCTGTLLVDSDPSTDVPYFLTANHCVSGQSRASNIEVYWLWQSPTCGGDPPLVTEVPRTTGGADFLAGTSHSSGTDFSLLRLRSAPPEGVTYLGWTSDAVAIGAETACIHHPRGDYKRISFGDKTGEDSGYHVNLWSDGTTEPGSSGSPLMLLETQQVIGQLYGGLASCSLPDEPDEYGRFDVSFALIQQYLAQYDGPEDINEDGAVNATDVQLVINGALGIAGDYPTDVTGDGLTNAADVQMVINAALGR